MPGGGQPAGTMDGSRNLTIPNVLTALRGLAAAPIVVAILGGHFRIALALVFLAGVSDGADGMLARRLNQSSNVGRLLDPIADKTLLIATFVAISLPGFGFEPLPWWLAALVIARDVAIVLAGWVIYRRTGFSGFTPTLLGKINTVLELVVVGFFLIQHAFWLPPSLMAFTVGLTTVSIVVSGLNYITHSRRQLSEYRAARQTPPAAS